ncbi:MAG: GIY-YIG nuclease family protein [Hassallia sp. WJT32-NPBG1]|nr:GIY-YIG nuclease family protein [Hassallia sp. WJT32-NPBG1]
MKAVGYGGIIPGVLIGRYKIGLSRNPEARLDQLHSAQPCCDIEILHTVAVEDMEYLETKLHDIFKNSNVKLRRSREWFSLNPIQVQQCIWVMDRHRTTQVKSSLPFKVIAASLMTLLGVGLLIGQNFQPEPVNETKVQRAVKPPK